MIKSAPRKIGMEAFVTMANRVSNPICIFASIAFLSRTLTQSDFQNFLVAFSLSQWALQFGFQWIKNGIVKTFDSKNFESLTAGATLSSSIFVFAFIHTTLKMDAVTSMSVAFFTISNGIIYVTVTRKRMHGEIFKAQAFEISGVIIRWSLACLCAMAFKNIHSIFFAMTLINTITALLTSKPVTQKNLQILSYRFKAFFVLSISLLATDISSSTMLYLDRILTKDADLIIHSTIGTQATTVIFGALLAMFIPRVALKAKNDDAWPRRHLAYFLILLALSIPSLLLVYFLGPIALEFIAPDISPNAGRLTWYAAAQVAHFTFTLTALFFILKHHSYVPAIVYFISCASYIILVTVYPENIHPNYPNTRFILLILATLSLWLLRFNRKFS